MTRFYALLASCLVLTACGTGDAKDTNPFIMNNEDATAGGGTSTNTTKTDTGEPISSDRTVLPGTVSPSSSDQIFRTEARSDSDGDGFATGFRYNAKTDEFFVDNLAFDGEGGYQRVTNAAGENLGIGPFGVFSSPAFAADGLTSAEVDQLEYRALYGIGPDGNTSIAIVRSGGYIEFGFGGYIYQRDGAVVLPKNGQAVYTGKENYGGLRDFKGRGGLEMVNGDAEVFIDFDDFNAGAGVRGVVKNRRVFDTNGNDITSSILSAMGSGITQLPSLRFVIEPGVLDSNGELTGDVISIDPSEGDTFESGKYFAVLSGSNARHITGVIVVSASDPRFDDVTVRETGGFFASRK